MAVRSHQPPNEGMAVDKGLTVETCWQTFRVGVSVRNPKRRNPTHKVYTPNVHAITFGNLVFRLMCVLTDLRIEPPATPEPHTLVHTFGFMVTEDKGEAPSLGVLPPIAVVVAQPKP